MQSVVGFKPLGALVMLIPKEQLPIERLAVRTLDLNVASMYQLLTILLIVCLVSVILLIKIKKAMPHSHVACHPLHAGVHAA